MKHYLGNVWKLLRGVVWLWTREAEMVRVSGTRRDSVLVWRRAKRPMREAPLVENSITYKPGWSPLAFLPVYLLNVGSHVILSGGAVTTWSRAAWDLRQSGNRWGKVLDRFLQAVLGDDHGKEAGPVLWGTTPCEPKVRWFVALFWTLLIVMSAT